jgi:hypothetical protein
MGDDQASFFVRLADDLVDYASVNVSQAKISAGMAEGEALVINPHQMENRGVEIMDMNRVFSH